MVPAVALVLAVLAAQHGLKHDHQADVVAQQRMQQREEYLRQEMTRLLQEMEGSGGTDKATLLSVLRQWPFWAAAGALVLLAEVRWLARKMKLASDSRSEQDSSRSEEEDEEEEEELGGAHHGVRSLAVSTPSPVQGLPDTCKVLKELVGDLLGVCRVLCKRTFMPQMHPAVGMDGAYEAWRVHENSIAYRLLVFLQPPPGHSFSLELGTTGQLPASRSGVSVALECLCSREQLLGDMLCFLHHQHDDKLPSLYLLRTLCTRSRLDVEKIACWVQRLVTSAWLLLPQSYHCQLTVLPSSQSCRFQLTSTSKINICTEMIFAVQQSSSGPYLSLEVPPGPLHHAKMTIN
ncbi:PREDICTED: inositol 1,4,5-trisphosphate receptor-interacting protein-like 1 [Haliaeetus leucocephalus]|uniref:inositol 1,4,5-trisphosphate receptor-interacting protein-like 1 n=1 Tax=Haliaeetus leucocephalus TaxID=52644 RepID=UPI00053CC973|nr:PREDICTED: inositol 1,4,5-trisphosphate receptor-interacting protein-like 1 [Haliaeetus leucocephalus]